MSDRIALITGITGQDGAFLAELLLSKGYVVHGIKRRASSFNTGRVDHLYVDPHEPGARFFMHYGDLTDATNLIRIVQQVQPDEIYNLAAQSHVQVSFETPEYTANADGIGALIPDETGASFCSTRAERQAGITAEADRSRTGPREASGAVNEHVLRSRPDLLNQFPWNHFDRLVTVHADDARVRRLAAVFPGILSPGRAATP